jgi:hypothetical protein
VGAHRWSVTSGSIGKQIGKQYGWRALRLTTLAEWRPGRQGRHGERPGARAPACQLKLGPSVDNRKLATFIILAGAVVAVVAYGTEQRPSTRPQHDVTVPDTATGHGPRNRDLLPDSLGRLEVVLV